MKWLALTGLIALVAGPAAASVFDTYGFGARATAMGNAHAAASEDYTAVYYNPAALTVHKTPYVGTGLNIVAPNLFIDRGVSPGEDAPSHIVPSTNAGINLGLLFPLGGLIENRFALGIGTYMPAIQVTRVDAVDPQTPAFYRYNALPDKLIVAAGAAFELHKTVSLGLGYQFLGSLDGGADVELDMLTQRFTRKALKVDVHADSSLTAGILVRPTKALKLGFSFRDALQLKYRLITRINIKDAGLLVADIGGTSLYTPQQYTWAVAYEPRDDMVVTVDLVWARWSAAPDPTSHIDVTLDGEPLGLGDVTATTPETPLGGVDTLSPRLGVEWTPTPDWAVRGGYGYHPTPLPAQKGHTNFIDSDTHQFGVGGGYAFPDPLAIHDAPINLDVAAQLSWLTTRDAVKLDPTDPVGSYSAGGHIWNLSVTVSHEFY